MFGDNSFVQIISSLTGSHSSRRSKACNVLGVAVDWGNADLSSTASTVYTMHAAGELLRNCDANI